MQMLLMVLYPGISRTSIPKKVRFSPGICPLTRPRFLSYPRMRMLSLCPSPESDKAASKPRKAYHCIASEGTPFQLLAYSCYHVLLHS